MHQLDLQRSHCDRIPGKQVLKPKMAPCLSVHEDRHERNAHPLNEIKKISSCIFPKSLNAAYNKQKILRQSKTRPTLKNLIYIPIQTSQTNAQALEAQNCTRWCAEI